MWESLINRRNFLIATTAASTFILLPIVSAHAANRSVKCVVVGDQAVGKTCMLISYTTNTFPGEYVPTVFDNYSADVRVNNRTYQLGLWDTAGQGDYDRLRPLSYPDTDVFLVCFSCVSENSLNSVTSKWIPELRHYAPGTPIVLVRTKGDLLRDGHQYSLIPDSKIQSVHRLVEKRWGQRVPYLTNSALTQENLRNTFDTAINVATSPLIRGTSKPATDPGWVPLSR